MGYKTKSIIAIVLILSAVSFGATYSGGSGTQVDPYKISSFNNWKTLMTTSADWDKQFLLMADINLAGVALTPVGNSNQWFTGGFDGNGHRMLNAVISLFGYVGGDGHIRNLGVEDVNISGSGGLVGYNDGGTITACYATGTVASLGTYSHVDVGGLVGSNSQRYGGGIITGCYSTVTVTSTSGGSVGGLVGENSGTITNCYSTGAVSDSYSASYVYVGGLVGHNSGTVTRCFWDVQTSGQTNSDGGIGKTTAEMKNIQTYLSAGWDFVNESANGLHDFWQITENDYPRLAPHSWTLSGNGTVDSPYVIANVSDLAKVWLKTYANYYLSADLDLSGISWSTVMVPIFSGTFDGNGHIISNLTYESNSTDLVGLFGYIDYSSKVMNLGLVDVNIVGNNNVGGLVGYGGTVSNCYSTGSVSGVDNVGGLVGSGGVSNCYSTVSVKGTGTYVGGLVGHGGSIRNCYSTGSVSGIDRVGGLAGYGATIINCYSTGSVNGVSDVGGLVGNNSSGSITSCYATGSVTGTGTSVGGLAGFGVNISNCYSTSSVTGVDYIGGLAGYGRTINNCYSAGSVTGTGTYVGGLIGKITDGAISNCFWDIQTSGQTTSDGGIGKTTAEMKNIQTYLSAGWDFVNESANGLHDFWQITENDYPMLALHSWTLSGSGTTIDPYIIANAVDLAKVWLRSGSYRLVGDLDLSGISWSTVIVPTVSTFDGNGHIISNLTYDSNSMDSVGLFGYISYYGKIMNLGVVDVNIIGNNTVGGLVGENHGTISNCHSTGSVKGLGYRTGGLVASNHGTISDCYTSGSVNGVSGVGGLVGENEGIDYYKAMITNCYSTCSVIGVNTVGGLVGENYGYSNNYNGSSNAYVDRSFSSGSVSGEAYVGGLLGGNYSGGVRDCYSTAQVDGNNCVGGLLGSYTEGTIERCYSTGTVSGTSITGGLIGAIYSSDSATSYCFWDVQTSGQTTSAGGTGKTTVEMKTISTFIVAKWDFVSETVNGTNDYWILLFDGVDYPRLAWQTSYGGGIGTVLDPYQIYTAEQLNTIGLIKVHSNKCFKLMNDIDMSDYTGTQYNIINNFTGTFDGDGHVISNLTYTSTNSTWNVGMFGSVGAGSIIKNLGIENVFMSTAGFNVGGLVGSYENYSYQPAATIINCYTTGIVSSGGSVGGIVGNYGGTISNCYSTVSVTGIGVYVGGLAGYGATISNCYSTGSVTGTGTRCYIGGLAGGGATISNCYSTGSVTGTGTGCYIGGLAGYLNRYGSTISNCYSTGSVTGTGVYVGGLLGYIRFVTINGCLWDIHTSGQSVGVGYGSSTGIVGKTTAEMKTLSTFIDVDWDLITTWSICDGTNYPKLQWQIPAGDFVCPDGVNLVDYSFFAQQWQYTNCEANNDCDGTDLDISGTVDWEDMMIFCQHWLEGIEQ